MTCDIVLTGLQSILVVNSSAAEGALVVGCWFQLLVLLPFKQPHNREGNMSEIETPIVGREGSMQANAASADPDRDVARADQERDVASADAGDRGRDQDTCIQLISNPSVLEKYGVVAAYFNMNPSPWISTIPSTPIFPADLLNLVASLEFSVNRRHIVEHTKVRSNAKRSFFCNHCQDFKLVFGRHWRSKSDDPFCMKVQACNLIHDRECTHLKCIPTHEILSNLPLFINFVRQQSRTGGKATRNNIENHLISHNMSCATIPRTNFYRAISEVVISTKRHRSVDLESEQASTKNQRRGSLDKTTNASGDDNDSQDSSLFTKLAASMKKSAMSRQALEDHVQQRVSRHGVSAPRTRKAGLNSLIVDRMDVRITRMASRRLKKKPLNQPLHLTRPSR
jgi:hypothetical protein